MKLLCAFLFLFVFFISSVFAKGEVRITDKVFSGFGEDKVLSVEELLRHISFVDHNIRYSVYVSGKNYNAFTKKQISINKKVSLKVVMSEIRKFFPHSVIIAGESSAKIIIQDSVTFTDPFESKFKNKIDFTGTLNDFINILRSKFPEIGISLPGSILYSKAALHTKVNISIRKGMTINAAFDELCRDFPVGINAV